MERLRWNRTYPNTYVAGTDVDYEIKLTNSHVKFFQEEEKRYKKISDQLRKHRETCAKNRRNRKKKRK